MSLFFLHFAILDSKANPYFNYFQVAAKHTLHLIILLFVLVDWQKIPQHELHGNKDAGSRET